MINEEDVHLHLIRGLDRLLPSRDSILFSTDPQSMDRTTVVMPLGAFLGVVGNHIDNAIGASESVDHRQVMVDRSSLLGLLDDPVRFVTAHWPLARNHLRVVEEYAVAIRASLLLRLGLLTLPRGRDRSAIPTVTVGGAFGSRRGGAEAVLMDECMLVAGPQHTPELGGMYSRIRSLMRQRIPADLLAAYWDRYREHFLVAQFGPGLLRDMVMANRLDGLMFGPDESYLRYLDERGLVQGLPAGPGVPSELRKLTVLLRPSRTVFGHRVQVESDGREVFVKPVAADGK